nr:MAG TPA: hypothetical protein [Caudoviricetes sp.]
MLSLYNMSAFSQTLRVHRLSREDWRAHINKWW